AHRPNQALIWSSCCSRTGPKNRPRSIVTPNLMGRPKHATIDAVTGVTGRRAVPTGRGVAQVGPANGQDVHPVHPERRVATDRGAAGRDVLGNGAKVTSVLAPANGCRHRPNRCLRSRSPSTPRNTPLT